MLVLRPDLFVHAGDTIYADEPMTETVELEDGSTWHNDLTDEVVKVDEKLTEFCGRHAYPLRDDHVRAFYAKVPTAPMRSDEHTAELQSLLHHSSPLFCLKKKNT